MIRSHTEKLNKNGERERERERERESSWDCVYVSLGTRQTFRVDSSLRTDSEKNSNSRVNAGKDEHRYNKYGKYVPNAHI